MDTDREDLAATVSELHQLLGQLMRRMRAAHEGAALTLSQAAVLYRLVAEGPHTPAALARAERVRPQSMGATLGALEEQGLVVRGRHPTDGRQVVMTPTEAGSRLLEEIRSAKEGWLLDAIATRLDPDEQRTLIASVALLRRLVES
ncbi:MULTISPECIES: MarR family winged helix-turn-helix transcriptional regulator [Streptacidiphilus]|uniref:MarR family winged helix-turn-helix transcriptional regulator n=2 Tax=Streptacidiphilus TaxID=228398 RepID=A0ABV6UR90_9ACTN|nr:MarR family transcriptional regulator [Streptacidiphilus jeojiense]